MTPTTICRDLGQHKLDEVIAKLSSAQIKAVLKEGGIKVKLPGGVVTQQRRRKAWTSKIMDALETSNEQAAAELLQQWLLNHHRGMLIAYLDFLGVKHQAGETDQSFLVSSSQTQLRDAGAKLLAAFDVVEVRAYLRYIAYQQESTAFDGWDALDG